MKKISLSVFSFLALCILLCTACSNDTPYKADLSQIQRTIDISRDSLSNELWLEVEKNEVIKLCLDSKVRTWETKLHSKNLNDSCLAFQVPTLIGVDTIKVYFPDDSSSHNINLAVGMKYLNFKNEEVLLGYSTMLGSGDVLMITTTKGSYFAKDEDPERLKSVTATYLVDKYPVTNCEITQLMWDSIPMNPSHFDLTQQFYAEKWALRKKNSSHGEKCPAHDAAASSIFLFQAIKYANTRSIREGLKPYYIITNTTEENHKIKLNGHYIIRYIDFNQNNNENYSIDVSVDNSSDGYRLPYYDEWMMLARGGVKKHIKAPWGYDTTFENASKYAKFAAPIGTPVGQLLPNGYGLYDIFGLVEEHVLFEKTNPFEFLNNTPSCLKGGSNKIRKDEEEMPVEPHWTQISFGYKKPNYNGQVYAGFRLIRNIGNNAKWSNDKVQKRKQK